MTPSEWYAKTKICRDSGKSERRGAGDVLRCLEHGGECRMVKCQRVHKNKLHSPDDSAKIKS